MMPSMSERMRSVEWKCRGLICAVIVLVLWAMFSGCATYSYTFIDTDGASMSMKERVFLGKRDASASAAQYEWLQDGSGKWHVGGDTTMSDGTDGLATIEYFFEVLSDALKAYITTLAPIPVVP